LVSVPLDRSANELRLGAEQAVHVRRGDPRFRCDSCDRHRVNADDAEQIESGAHDRVSSIVRRGT